MTEIMLELCEELVDPAEAVLDDQLEKTLDSEADIMLGVGEDDDDVIDFIANGKRITNADPVDFTDDDVELTVQDDDEPTSVLDESVDIDKIEADNSFIY